MDTLVNETSLPTRNATTIVRGGSTVGPNYAVASDEAHPTISDPFFKVSSAVIYGNSFVMPSATEEPSVRRPKLSVSRSGWRFTRKQQLI